GGDRLARRPGDGGRGPGAAGRGPEAGLRDGLTRGQRRADPAGVNAAVDAVRAGVRGVSLPSRTAETRPGAPDSLRGEGAEAAFPAFQMGRNRTPTSAMPRCALPPLLLQPTVWPTELLRRVLQIEKGSLLQSGVAVSPCREPSCNGRRWIRT